MVISRKSKVKVYHRDWCPYAKRIQRYYRKDLSEEKLKSRGYHECSWCGGLHGKYIDVMTHPELYSDVRKPIQFYWDRVSQGFCMQTDVGFWKVLISRTTGNYSLFHLNHGDFASRNTVYSRMRGKYHRQHDVEQTTHLGKLVQYVSEHDKAKKIIDYDYRNLPKKTPKQRKYFKQAEKKHRRKEHKRLDELFRQLEKGEI